MEKLYVVRVGRLLTAWDCSLEDARRFAREDVAGIVEPQDDDEVTAHEESLPSDTVPFHWTPGVYTRMPSGLYK